LTPPTQISPTLEPDELTSVLAPEAPAPPKPPDLPPLPDPSLLEASELLFRRRPGESEDEVDRRWASTHCAPAEHPHLTLRAVLTGLVFGGVLALSNLYLGLKVGWANTVAITACVLSYSAWRALSSVGLAKNEISVHEQNCMAAVASSCGLSTGAVLYAAIPALLMATGRAPHPAWLFAWMVFGALLGVSISVPLKRTLVHHEELRFPSGIATAQTLASLHLHAKKSFTGTRQLLASMLASASLHFASANAFAWWPFPRIASFWSLPGRWMGRPLTDYGVGLELGGLSLAVGAILGVRISGWMLIGSTFSFLVAAPWLMGRGILEDLGFRSVLTGYSLWMGVAIMVCSSLTDLLLERGMIVRALRNSFGALRSARPAGADPLASIEIPASWSWISPAVASLGIVVVAQLGFGIPWWQSCIGIAFAAMLTLVAVRATGETDITPAGDLGRLTQLAYGGIAPGQLGTNLMMSSAVSAAAVSSADFTERQKVAYLLGTRPRPQFFGQLVGILGGALILVPAFFVLIPDPALLGSDQFPAPGAQSTRAVAELLSGGVDALSPVGKTAFLIGAIVGILLALAKRVLRRPRWWLPSAMGLGMGMVLDVGTCFTFCVGAAIVLSVRRVSAGRSERHELPVSSGLIAGESLMGVLLAVFVALGMVGGD